MIRKNNLSNKLNKLLELERSFISLLDKHLSASLDFSQLSKDDRDASLDFLKSRVNLQKKHIQLIEDIKKEIEESDQDVY
ncbi:MAG: hypothetical protein K9L87_05460 [Candidatus Omnitrophica bacterium]|jgi:predicted transcriptional regulator|nr:hypothetical protein [Candidatus Omnitrophota bacterium]MCF7877330.1 hypothetical protein [Candidatus Omnitrophota bacterium]MCF7891800.1 hypothetical protein [Candidatus Omnitrophota bacterium]MCF7898177.1 hypothetical protein [Candidatus Omnitrophota bacterium]MCF7909163.1 hypothetical protein [Candidatus Omnitrophota bacterium]